MKLGIIPLARPTFDIEFAQIKLNTMVDALEATGHEIIGTRELLCDESATKEVMARLEASEIDQVMILQVTFTDAAMTAAIGAFFRQPLSIWAIPEPRNGGRLRLNSFCGLNLASHALGLNQREFSWIYCNPEDHITDTLVQMLNKERVANFLVSQNVPETTDRGIEIAQAVKRKRIARIGDSPAGFDSCAYDPHVLKSLTGVEVEKLALEDLFNAARAVAPEIASNLRAEVSQQVSGLEEVNPDQLDRSLRLKAGLDTLKSKGNYDAFAIRCWPETFTEYGGAICAPASMMSEGKVPCACEADVYGALTQLILSEAAQAPVFLTDLVDMDPQDDTGVVWHCGQAPLSMCDPIGQTEATIHTNRKQPLLYQFTLKPGAVTFLRISQAHNKQQMVLGYGEMLRRPMSFTGTSGVVRFERNAGLVLNDIMASGLEHHMALAYGDHRDSLRGVAGALGLPVLDI